MTIQLRRDTAANWTAANPTLASGQPGYETDTAKLKIGDGSTAWASLAYFSGASSGGYTVATAGTSYTETATSGEKVVLVTGGSVNVTLPSAVSNTAKLTFKLTVSGTMTLTASGGQTIDGGSTAATSIQYTALTIVSDGANWQVI